MTAAADRLRHCPQCGEPLGPSMKSSAVYCSRACKDASRWSRSPEYRENTKKRSAKYRGTEKGLASSRRRQKRAYENHRHKFLARAAVQHAVRRGTLAKPERCEQCGTSGRLEAHHHRGYDGEARLDVVWLCKPCHVVAG